MCHFTCDMWHVTHYIQAVVNIVSKSQVRSSNGLWFLICWRFGGKRSLNQLLTKVFVSPATPGLLNIIREARIKAFENVMYHWVKGTLVPLWKEYIFTKSAPSPVIMPLPTLFLLMVLLTWETPGCHQQVQPEVTIKFPFYGNTHTHTQNVWPPKRKKKKGLGATTHIGWEIHTGGMRDF